MMAEANNRSMEEREEWIDLLKGFCHLVCRYRTYVVLSSNGLS